MVNGEAVGLVPKLAVLVQGRGHELALFPGIREDEALSPARMLEDVADAGVRAAGREV